MRSLLNEKNVVYVIIYCWPYFKELMELENGLFARWFCRVYSIHWPTINEALLCPHSEITV